MLNTAGRLCRGQLIGTRTTEVRQWGILRFARITDPLLDAKLIVEFSIMDMILDVSVKFLIISGSSL